MVARSIQKPFRKKRTTKPLKRARMVPTKALTNAIEKIQLKNQETKKFQKLVLSDSHIHGNGLKYDFANDVMTGGAGVPNLLAQSAKMATGSTEITRVGNEIKPVSLTLRGFIKAAPYNATTNSNKTPFDVYMVVYKKKNEPEGVIDSLKDYTDGTKGAITGSIQSTVLNPFNRDNYVIKKVMKFSMKAQPLINNNPITNPPTIAPTSENGESGRTTRDHFRLFSVKVPIKKMLKYNISSEQAPINDWCGVGFYYINGDAAATTASEYNQVRASITCESILRFKDA